MRCLSIRQPYAWAVCAGVKTTENRVWKTDFRGTIAIHASGSPQYVNSNRKTTGIAEFTKENFAFGAVIGMADIVDVAAYGQQHESDGHATGPYCFTIANPKLLKNPIPMKGKLNLFQLDSTIAGQLSTAEFTRLEFANGDTASRLKTGLTSDPDVAANYEYLIQDLWAKNEAEALTHATDRLIALEPENVSGYIARYMLADRSHDEMLADAKRMVAIDPDNAFGYACVGWSLHCLGEHRQAKEQLDRSLKMAQDIPNAWYSRGCILHALQQYEDAICDFTQELERDPECLDALIGRARSQLALGRMDAARQGSMQALHIEQDFAPALALIEELDG